MDGRRHEYPENHLQRVYTGDKFMTENSSAASGRSDVGQAAIDAYLDSVEQALLAANAPRGDRVQVLQDLETQIADMLAIGQQPLTEEIVQWLIAKLEPPSHFAATYGNGNGNSKEPKPDWVAQIASRSSFRWPFVASLSCACLCVGCLMLLLAGGTMFNGGPFVVLIVLMLLAGFVLTPIALWKAVKQLQAQPDEHRDRELVLKSALVYCVIVPALLMGFLTLATHGFIVVPFGLAAFVYLQYMFVRRPQRHLSETLPPQPAGDATAHTAAPAVGTGMTVPAV